MVNFSPLFIGELSLTMRWCRKTGSILHFSPLFIGELSLTSANSVTAPNLGAFQSPLHRGALFNAGYDLADLDMDGISVPSSSGNSL